MDAIFSPYITIVANFIVGILVAKGIVDNSTRQQTYQLINNFLAATLTLILGIYGMYITHKTHKVKMDGAIALQAGSIQPIMPQQLATPSISQETQLLSHTGLPLSK